MPAVFSLTLTPRPVARTAEQNRPSSNYLLVETEREDVCCLGGAVVVVVVRRMAGEVEGEQK